MPDPLSIREREAIFECLSRDRLMSWTRIGVRVGRHRTTISREVNRNGGRASYSPHEANQRAIEQSKRPKPLKLETDQELAHRVTRELHQGFSPAAIAIRVRADGMQISHETIYGSLYAGVLEIEAVACLRTRRRQRRRQGAVRTTNLSGNYLGEFRRIADRPQHINDRNQFGHWEGDLIGGAHNQTALVTLFERSTRYTLLFRLPNSRTSQQVVGAIKGWAESVDGSMRRSLTWDRGSELTNWTDIDELFDDGIWFCDPRSPWQKGACEQNNRTLRFWFPRGTSLKFDTDQPLNQALDVLNHQPRRSLNWHTPHQLYHHHVR